MATPTIEVSTAPTTDVSMSQADASAGSSGSGGAYG